MDVKQGIDTIIAAHLTVPLTNSPQDIIESGEIVSERTANVKVFDLGGGMRQAKVYSCPIHYYDGFGFKSIDPSVKRKPLSNPLQTYMYEVKSGLYHAHFKEDKPYDYRFEVGDSWIEYEALFEESESLSIKVETSWIGVKETITLKDEKAPVSFSWRFTASVGKTDIIVLPPTAQDARGKNVPIKTTIDGDVLTYDLDLTDAVYPIILDPTSVVTSNDGDIPAGSVSYSTARSATAGASTDTDALRVGQYTTPTYYVYRSYGSFLIPDMGFLAAASLFLEGAGDYSTTDFEIYIHTSTYSTPLVKEDFDLFDGHQELNIPWTGTVLNDTWDSSSYSATWNEIVFNAAGLAVIFAKKNDTLKIALISKEDYDDSAPTANEYVAFESSATSGKEPYLSLTYYVIPTVTTQAASSVADTSCTGNGNITATGGENCSVRGFCYMEGTTGDPTVANSKVYDDAGGYGTGAYTKGITGLTAGSAYRVRAYAVNDAGVGYGTTAQVYTSQTVTLPVIGMVVAAFVMSVNISCAVNLESTPLSVSPYTIDAGSFIDLTLETRPLSIVPYTLDISVREQLSSRALTITPKTLSLRVDADVSLESLPLEITPRTLDVTVDYNQNVTLECAEFTISPHALRILAKGRAYFEYSGTRPKRVHSEFSVSKPEIVFAVVSYIPSQVIVFDSKPLSIIPNTLDIFAGIITDLATVPLIITPNTLDVYNATVVTLAKVSLEITPNTLTQSFDCTVELEAVTLEITPNELFVGAVISLTKSVLEITPNPLNVTLINNVSLTLTTRALTITPRVLSITAGKVIDLETTGLTITPKTLVPRIDNALTLAKTGLKITPKTLTTSIETDAALENTGIEMTPKTLSVIINNTQSLVKVPLTITPKVLTITIT